MTAISWQRVGLVVGIILLLLAGLWYFLENPASQMFGNTVTRVPLQQKIVALTYDDGPNPPYTNEIVTYLHQQHVLATFFVVGRAVAAHPEVVRMEVRDGNALGNHSWDHAHLVLETPRHIRAELLMTDAAIVKATGVHTRLFRPPFGARDYYVINVARRMGYEVIMWSVPLSRDWQNPPPELILDRVLPYVRDGSIIVLHDGNRGRPGNRAATVAATKLIVKALEAQGYRFVTVPELLKLGLAENPRPNATPTE
ncbi:MAG TPA: polysaccharide deacetylase family protein [Candidatus Acidoferrales bacterium]|nr:polysaccharide deacetylase family protein [Candidatus Acidoferrales bacterium]